MIKRSTKNETTGAAKNLKGKVKEHVGRAANRPDVQDEGTADRVEGKVQRKVGQIQRVFEK